MRPGGDAFDARPDGDVFGARPGGDVFGARPGGDAFEARPGGDAFGARPGSKAFSARPGSHSVRGRVATIRCEAGWRPFGVRTGSDLSVSGRRNRSVSGRTCFGMRTNVVTSQPEAESFGIVPRFPT